MLKHSLKKGLIALSLSACFALSLQAKINALLIFGMPITKLSYY